MAAFNRTSTLKAIAWSGAQGWGTQLIGLITFSLLARYLEPSDFGLVAIATIYTTLIQTITDQGMTLAIIQKKDLTNKHLSSAFYMVVLIGSVLTLSGILLAPLIASIFRTPEVVPILRYLSLTVFINSLSVVFIAALMRDMNFKSLAIRSVLSTLLGGLVGVVMAVNGFGALSLVAQLLVSSIVQLVILVWFSKWRLGLEFSLSDVLELYRYGVSVLGINLCEFASRQMDNLIIGYFLGPVALGYYTIAYKLYTVLTSLISGISNVVVFSTLSKLQNDVGKMRHVFYQAVKHTSVVTFPYFVGSSVLAFLIFPIVVGDQWNDSIPVYQILAFAALVESIFLYNGNVILAMGKPHWRLGLSFTYAFVNCIGYYIAVQWGIAAVALAYVLRTWLLSPLPLYLVRKLIKIDIRSYLSSLLHPILACFAMAAVLVMVINSVPFDVAQIIQFIVLVITGIIIYSIALALLDRERISEILRMGRSVMSR